LILLDVMMPGLDGLEVCRRIRQDPEIGRIPIIIVTTLAGHDWRLKALEAGADAFLTKPCQREELRARVRTIARLDRFRSIIEQQRALQDMNAHLEELVQARTNELEEANALLMSYASFVSHDLRTPLTVIKGYLGLIHEGAVSLDASAAPLIEQAYKASMIMQEMLENILQLARDENAGTYTGPQPATDPTPIVQRLAVHLCSLNPRARPRFEIASLPALGVSPIVIERVFYNIIGNALKFSEGLEPVIEIGGRLDPEGPVVFVRDHGVGFDERDADKLFQEFSRLPTARRRTGFGLGLSLVSRLIRMHGGRIWAKGALGEGATFYVQFPRPEEQASEHAAAGLEDSSRMPEAPRA
jgi:signal transduction histidine kinase